ncbi:MAG: N-acetylmannosamine-6-phosphate 2-epimerase [Trueperaceae bacterium]|nr:N-acetylmannosamine-6-phosphate 2-epimerase [Trueperaceae bacterium]
MLTRGLIVSCQAPKGTALEGSIYMAAMAKAAEAGGAVALRANGPDDIRAIKQVSQLPVIGLWKQEIEGFEPYITPTLASAQAIAEAGSDIIALDATLRPHPEGSMTQFLQQVKADLRLPIFADVSSLEEGLAAADAGADYISTTLSGYTPYTQKSEEPDFQLLKDLSKALGLPIVAEGRIWTPEQLKTAFDLGAYAVVVGTAITNPQEITRRFVKAISEKSEK